MFGNDIQSGIEFDRPDERSLVVHTHARVREMELSDLAHARPGIEAHGARLLSRDASSASYDQ